MGIDFKFSLFDGEISVKNWGHLYMYSGLVSKVNSLLFCCGYDHFSCYYALLVFLFLKYCFFKKS